MADNPVLDNGTLTDIIVSADDSGALGQVQRVKLAYSADGSAVHVTADADGLLVNLGAQNDVTLASLPPLVAGSASIGKLAANSGVDIGDVTLTAGTDYIGKTRATDGTTDADIYPSGGAYDGPVVFIGDSTGAIVGFPPPVVLASTPTLDTAAYANGDSMDTTVMSFASAVVASGGTGHILKASVIDDDNQGQNIDLWLFESSVTPAAENAAHSLSDGDLGKCVGVISFNSWHDATLGQVSIQRMAPPLAYNCSGSTTLFGIPVSRGTGTYTASGLEFKLHVIKD